jgi:hypothetical protein
MLSIGERLTDMHVIAGKEVAELIHDQGGDLFVWTDPHRCCSGTMTYLKSAATPASGRRFARYDVGGFVLWFDGGAMEPPDELHLEVKGWKKKRIEAYWNGCAFAI